MRPIRNTLAVLVASLLVPALLHADVPDQNLNGTWRLDWDRSESFKPALKAIEVGWFMRSLARVARVDAFHVAYFRASRRASNRSRRALFVFLSFTSPRALRVICRNR